MKFITKAGFTLIELLVVITIIGILATGATTVYTSQIQKARDSNRITSIADLKLAVEQVYADESEYPYSSSFASGAADEITVGTFMELVPNDPKTGQACNGGTPCDYLYIVWQDSNFINFAKYELSTAFENDANRIKKAASASDGGTDPLRYEVGIDVDGNITSHGSAITSDACLTPDGSTPGDTSLIKVGRECK